VSEQESRPLVKRGDQGNPAISSFPYIHLSLDHSYSMTFSFPSFQTEPFTLFLRFFVTYFGTNLEHMHTAFG